ncbi:ABC transporter substrate-binding protein [Streptomyces alkaliphilus]|uniref:ABC transporter substrate-binding protein n=1 Tax=Streptomyces alkaliphilus TaxID=1472722 RepID=UPI00117C8414|nr:ABC transporter substrate-binding protein [Streptomyces alkaliphilus]MQS08357.1 ABC transporter substrate-binding protein [Streptomyces alkaliphilus]
MTSSPISRRVPAVLLAGTLAFLATGCGSDPGGSDTGGAGGTDAANGSATAGAPEGFPFTVENCGTEVTYEQPPERAVSLNQHATEVMLALDLADSMVGTGYLDDEILPEYREDYDAVPVVSEQYPSYETLLALEPDFVYGGFSSTFDAQEGRSREAFASHGIATHLNIEECSTPPLDIDLMDREVRDIARIFGVPERADAELERLHGVLDGVAERLEGVEPVDVFVYDSGETTAFTAGGGGIGNEMINRAGATNLFADLDRAFGDVSFEQVAERAPEVIVIYDYGDRSVEDKKRFLLDNPALRDVPAIREERFAVLPLSSTVLGVRVPDGVESLARQLHPDRFR